MSGGVKMGLSILVLIILLGAGWYAYKYMGKNTEGAPQTETTTDTNQQAADTPPSLITSSDTTDAGLEADLAAIDGQITVASQDAAAVDAGMNDKQVTQ